MSRMTGAPRRCARCISTAAVLTSVVVATAFLIFLPPSAWADEEALPPPLGTLVKVVILSRHGVRSPIPSLCDLDPWTTRKPPKDSPWPKWTCAGGKECSPGELTPRGRELADHMGLHYAARLSTLIPPTCPTGDDVWFWADLDERTMDTAEALLHGFRPKCNMERFLHHAEEKKDRIFHPVDGANCKLNVSEAQQEILLRAGGDLTVYVTKNLSKERQIAQDSLQCCQPALCEKIPLPCGPRDGRGCKLADLPTCLAADADQNRVQLFGGLRTAGTYAEIMLLEYANGFASQDVGWGIDRDSMAATFLLHTKEFDLEQRTPYIAKLQGSRLFKKILLALQGKSDGEKGTAPVDAKFVAYVGHDTNIANLAAMLGLSWQQPGYQKDQTPPAGALVFERRKVAGGPDRVYVYYTAQSLDDMRAGSGYSPVRTAVPVPGCGSPCSLDTFATLVDKALDPQSGCR